MLWISTEEQRRLLLWVKANMRKLKSIIEKEEEEGEEEGRVTKIVKMDLASYNALTTKDANTLYVIVS